MSRMTIGSFSLLDGTGRHAYYFTGEEEQCENHRYQHMRQEAEQKLGAAKPILQQAMWKLTEATEKNQKVMADYAAQAAYDDRVLAEAIAFHKLRTEQRLAAEAATQSDSAVELEQLQRCVSAAESVKADCEAAIAAAQAGFVAIQEAKKEAARAAEREKWDREAASVAEMLLTAKREKWDREATPAPCEAMTPLSMPVQPLDKISAMAVRLMIPQYEAEAVVAYLYPKDGYNKNTLLALQVINRIARDNRISRNDAEIMLRE